MVLKAGKYGVNSGNTLRLSNTSRYLRHYSKSSFIIRHTTKLVEDNTDNFDTGLGEYELNEDDTVFSMNKKARWSLPELIKRQIRDGNKPVDNLGFLLIERHTIAKRADCFSIYTKKAENGNLKNFKRRRYLHSCSAASRRLHHSRRECDNKRGTRLNDNIDELETETDQVIYDVWYPVPGTCALRHNLKYIKPKTNKCDRDWKEARRQNTLNKKASFIRLSREACFTLNTSIEDYDNDAMYEYEAHLDQNMTDFVSKPPKITLQDSCEKAMSFKHIAGKHAKEKLTKGNETQQSRPNSTKGHTVLLNAEAPTPLVSPENSQSAQHVTTPISTGNPTHSEPMHVILPLLEITPSALRRTFGNCYIECDSVPRKFVLDISDRVSSIDVHEFKSYKKNFNKVNACIVFNVDEESELNTMTDVVCIFVLKMNYSIRRARIKIDTVFDYMENHLEELIKRVLFFIELFSSESILTNPIKVPYHDDRSKYNHLEELAGWKTNSYTVNDDFLLKYLFSCGIKHDSLYAASSHFHVNTNICKQEEAQSLSSCEISFDTDAISKEDKDFGADQGAISKATKELGPDQNVISKEVKLCGACGMTLHGHATETSLIACGHWFCDRCWQVHIEKKIHNGELKLHCLNYNCHEFVDIGTVISFAYMDTLIKYAKHYHDADVERQPTTRWCPNSKCGRVLKVCSPAVKIAMCVCGQQYCVDCLGNPHWPADCNSVKLFQQRIVSNGDSKIVPPEVAMEDMVDRRECHFCKRFVENKGKCIYTCICVCGKAFCWGCGWWFGYGTNVHTKDNHKMCHKECADKCIKKKTDADQDDKLDKISRRKWYKIALLHSVGHHPIKYANMNSAVKRISLQLKAFMSASEKKGFPITLDYQSEGYVHKQECDKVNDFLSSTIELYRQASQIVENTAVLLDSRRLDKNDINSSLQAIVNRLAYFVRDIYDLFVNADKRHEMDTLIRMKHARQQSMNAIRALVEYFSHKKM